MAKPCLLGRDVEINTIKNAIGVPKVDIERELLHVTIATMYVTVKH